MRRVRDVIVGADASMRERVQYGVTFSSSKSGDIAAFVRYSEPGVNLRLMRGGRLQGRYPHLEGRTVKRMRITRRERSESAHRRNRGDGERVVRPRRCREGPEGEEVNLLGVLADAADPDDRPRDAAESGQRQDHQVTRVRSR